MSNSEEIIEFGPFRLHVAVRLLQRDGVAVKIGSRSLDLLIALVERAGGVLSPRELIASAWSGLVVDEANVRVNIASLRKSLRDGEDGARYIVNIPGRGYSFVAPVSRAQIKTTPYAGSRLDSQPHGPVAAHSLPERLGRLIGRDACVGALVELFAKQRFVSIIGPGGMGKTTVAISVAHSLLESFGGAVYYVDLVSVTDASLVPGLIASVIGLKTQGQDHKASILAFFDARRALLVLDNCEHLIDETAALSEWLYKSAPKIHVLATSRELLRAEGEHVYILPPLDVPAVSDGMTASDAMALPAVQLFMERVAASGVQETVTDETAMLAVEICRRMDGIALAIQLAAGRVRSHGFHGTVELINSRFNLLWYGRRSAPLRHQTLQAMLDWSYNLLSENERRVLYRLSVFVGPFQLEAAQAIASDASLTEVEVATAISSLIDKSLLSPSILNRSSYLRLLDTTRTYAWQKLVDSGEINSVSLKLAEYLIAHFHRSSEPERKVNQDVMQVGNTRVALAWAFSETGNSEVGVCLAALTASHLLGLALLDECHRWCRTALMQLGSYEGTPTHLILQEALAMSALNTRVDRDELRTSIDLGLILARKFNDHDRELGLLAAQHLVMCHIGRFREAVDVSWRGVELASRVGSPSGLVMSQWMLGVAYHLAGDQTGALRHMEEGFKQAAAHGAIKIGLLAFSHRIRALITLARALWLSGAADRAAQVALQAVEEADADGQPMSMLVALLYSSTVFIWRGDPEISEALVNRLIQHAGRYSFGINAAFGLALSGEVALLRGEFRTAADKLCEALGVLQAERRHALTPTLNQSMSAALLECGEVLEAEAVIAAAMEWGEAEPSFNMPDLMRTRAKIGLVSGRLDSREAEAMFRHSIELADSQGARSLELRSAIDLGALLASQGRTNEAFAILARVYGGFTEGYETRDLIISRQLLEVWRPAHKAEGIRD